MVKMRVVYKVFILINGVIIINSYSILRYMGLKSLILKTKILKTKESNPEN